MKKLFTLLFVVMSFAAAKAQIADGSVAPDFTMTDINGQSHTLYNYLDSGYVVFLDFSATWCGPCWSFHNSHAFRDLYNDHGPNGTNLVRVFMIEGDASTTAADLVGTGSNTLGDWTAGIPYPIFDDASQTSPYQIGYWPTIYKVCPDGKTVYEAGQQSAEGFLAEALQSGCFKALTGTEAMVASYSGYTEFCSGGGSGTINVINLGSTPITAGTVTVKDASGATIATNNWTGNIASLGNANVNTGNVTISGTSDLTFEFTASGDNNMANNSVTKTIAVTQLESDQDDYTLTINTDAYGYETYWAIVDENNIIWSSGGNQAVGLYGGGGQAQNQTDPGAYGNNTTVTESFSLPVDGCYRFVMVDDWGDGLAAAGTNPGGSYVLKDDANQTLVNSIQTSFATEATAYAAVLFFTGVEDVNTISDVKVFPNPATVSLNVQFNVETSQDLSINVMNSLGQIVKVVNTGSLTAGQQNLNVNTSDMAAGIYFLNFTNGGQSTTKRFVVAK